MTGKELGEQQAHPIPGYDGPDRSMKAIVGMTKREYFSGVALQGLFAEGKSGDGSSTASLKAVAHLAIQTADALLEELAKVQP